MLAQYQVRRVEEGVYDHITEQVKALDRASLSTAELGKDFFRAVSKNGSYLYKTTADGEEEFKVCLFGEICQPALGTVVSAKGNHWPGRNCLPIVDSNTVKNTIVLASPTAAPVDLVNLFDDQVGALNMVRLADEEEERKHGMEYDTRDWLRPSSDDRALPLDLIAVTLPKTYGIPPKLKSTSAVRPVIKKRAADEINNDSGDEIDGALRASQSSQDFSPPQSVDEIRVGAFYDPSLLPDCQGSYFKFVNAKLVQWDLRDTENKLVPIFNIYETLRPGTVVLVIASLHCWMMSDDEKNTTRKVYQVNAHSVRVLSESEEPVELRVIPSLPVKKTDRQTPDTSPQKAFDSFHSPKKAKRAA